MIEFTEASIVPNFGYSTLRTLTFGLTEISIAKSKYSKSPNCYLIYSLFLIELCTKL
jgi:hypothetical protein